MQPRTWVRAFALEPLKGLSRLGGGAEDHLEEYVPACTKPRVRSSIPDVQACDSSTQEIKAGGSGVQGHF